MSDSRLTSPMMIALRDNPEKRNGATRREGDTATSSPSRPVSVSPRRPVSASPCRFIDNSSLRSFLVERQLCDEEPRAGWLDLNIADASARRKHIGRVPEINLRQFIRD